MEVIQALTQTKRTLSSIGPWIDDSKVLATNFVQLHYFHVRRERNRLAYNLVRYAINISNFLVWMKDVPPQFAIVLQADLANFI